MKPVPGMHHAVIQIIRPNAHSWTPNWPPIAAETAVAAPAAAVPAIAIPVAAAGSNYGLRVKAAIPGRAILELVRAGVNVAILIRGLVRDGGNKQSISQTLNK